MNNENTNKCNIHSDMEKTRAGIQSVEVGFVLLEALAQSSTPLMLRDLGQPA